MRGRRRGEMGRERSLAFHVLYLIVKLFPKLLFSNQITVREREKIRPVRKGERRGGRVPMELRVVFLNFSRLLNFFLW
jgi:hypothetical protein